MIRSSMFDEGETLLYTSSKFVTTCLPVFFQADVEVNFTVGLLKLYINQYKLLLSVKHYDNMVSLKY